ncbi:uncharacterized protein [Rutidosis leptorrhynchoides]|uniref:uncharacterized protein isoform X2 n=1 Tax=Rutidosis leptorrhynchoides TaxID=125765 RepID=UPI003A9966C7
MILIAQGYWCLLQSYLIPWKIKILYYLPVCKLISRLKRMKKLINIWGHVFGNTTMSLLKDLRCTSAMKRIYTFLSIVAQLLHQTVLDPGTQVLSPLFM